MPRNNKTLLFFPSPPSSVPSRSSNCTKSYEVRDGRAFTTAGPEPADPGQCLAGVEQYPSGHDRAHHAPRHQGGRLRHVPLRPQGCCPCHSQAVQPRPRAEGVPHPGHRETPCRQDHRELSLYQRTTTFRHHSTATPFDTTRPLHHSTPLDHHIPTTLDHHTIRHHSTITPPVS